MAPVLENKFKPDSTTFNVELNSSHIFRIERSATQGLHAVKRGAPESLAGTDTNTFTYIFPRLSHLFVAGQANHSTTSESDTHNTMPTCDGICTGVTVVAALVAISLSIYLSFSVVSWCGKYISGWIANVQRRTRSPVIATADTRTVELDFLPPYPGNFLPPYPESTVDIVDILPRDFWLNDDMQDIPTMNVALTLGPQTADERINQSPATLANTVAHISTSPNPSNIDNTLEISVPLAPRISTIQLPPVQDEVNITDLVHSSALFLQHGSDNTNMDETPTLTVYPDVNNLSLDYTNNADLTPVGALGIVLGGDVSLSSGADLEDGPL